MKRILTDKTARNQEKPWKTNKQMTEAVSKSYLKMGYRNLASRTHECGDYLKFLECTIDNIKILLRANFCHARNCIMCQWRKALVIRREMLDLVHLHLGTQGRERDIPLMLTLTIPNSSSEKFKKDLLLMTESWHRLMKRTRVLNIAKSWFRSLEVTYNKKSNTYHPHFHCIIMVPHTYFRNDMSLYIKRDEWLAMWKESTGIQEITQVDVRRVRKKSKRSLEGLISEVAKYATKPSTYVEKKKGKFVVNPEVLQCFHKALNKRRLIGFGGLFKTYRSKLLREEKQKDIEKADLVNIEDKYKDCKCPVCQTDMMERIYLWNIGSSNYFRDK